MAVDEEGLRRMEAELRERVADAGRGRRPVVHVDPLAVPAEGHVLFVATLPDDALDEAAVDDLLMVLQGFANQAAPGRSSVVALAQGCSLELLTDEQLAAAGLQRIPAEVVEPRLPSEVDVLREGQARGL